MSDYHKKMEEKMFAPGAFVMLHPKCNHGPGNPHADAGRIGKIISHEGDKMVVEFFSGLHSSTYSLIRKEHWLPVCDFMVEEYPAMIGDNGWRLSARGQMDFKQMGWDYTQASIGEE